MMCGPIKNLLRYGKPLTKHMLTYDLMDPYEQISANVNPITLGYNGRRFVDAISKCIPFR